MSLYGNNSDEQLSRGELCLTPPHFRTCLKPGLQLHMLWCFFMFNDLRWEVIVHFVDIGGIVDHDFLNFLFIITLNNLTYFIIFHCDLSFLFSDFNPLLGVNSSLFEELKMIVFLCCLSSISWKIKRVHYVFANNKSWFFSTYLIFGVLTPLSAIFKLYHGDQF